MTMFIFVKAPCATDVQKIIMAKNVYTIFFHPKIAGKKLDKQKIIRFAAPFIELERIGFTQKVLLEHHTWKVKDRSVKRPHKACYRGIFSRF